MDDADTRYFALLTAGNLPYPELVAGVLRGIFDSSRTSPRRPRRLDPLKRVARFETAMKELRQELASEDAMRRSLAARALGMLHDRDAIEGHCNLTGTDDQMCANAAAEALRDITKGTFGPTAAVDGWWAENRAGAAWSGCWRRCATRISMCEPPASRSSRRAVNDHARLPRRTRKSRSAKRPSGGTALLHQRGRWQRFDL